MALSHCAEYAERVLATVDLGNLDAIELHGVRAAGGVIADMVIDNAAPERISTYFCQIAGEPWVRSRPNRPST